MRALKILVVVMGIMLLAGSAGLAIAIVHRASTRVQPKPAGAPAVAIAADHAVAKLASGTILGMTAVGDKLAFRVARPGGGQIVQMVDPATGAVTGTLDLPPAP